MGHTPRLARLGGGSLALAGCCAIAAAALGLAPLSIDPPPDAPPAETAPRPDRVIIYCRDGRRVEGRLVRQSPKEVVVEIAGIETAFNMNDVLRVNPVPPVGEQYEQLRSVIADDDVEQLLLLADWLRDREAYSLALKELAHILQVEPDNKDASRLKLQVESLVRLKAQALANQADADQPARAHDPARRPDFPVLTPDQINLLKVYEINLNDPPRMTVDRDTIHDLIAAYEGNDLIPQSREGQAALERRPPAFILELMFRLKAREFYNRVRVEGEPKAFELFRDNVQRPWLLNSCASTACHGGQQAGRLWLCNTSPNAEKSIYTNFLILDRYRLPDGTPLINYDEPAKSPLLQMALPREDSLYPHPLVATSSTAAWKPMIGSQDDVRFREAIEWINAMYRPHPDYPVSYTPPEPTEGVPELPNDPIGER